MKKRYLPTIVVLILSLTTLTALFCGCANNAKTEKETIVIEYDGLSAYEIFCKHYIYIESEKQWIDDLTDGTLERIDNSVLEEKFIWRGSIEDKFTDDKVILTIDKYFCDKTFTAEDFHMIDVAEVKSLGGGRASDGSPANQIYTLTLREPSKVNVIKAIRKLEIFAFTKMASPNGLDAAADS